MYPFSKLQFFAIFLLIEFNHKTKNFIDVYRSLKFRIGLKLRYIHEHFKNGTFRENVRVTIFIFAPSHVRDTVREYIPTYSLILIL